MKDQEQPKRRRTRLPGYDYSRSGAYFVTICTQKKEKFLGEVVGRGLAPAENVLSSYGQIAEEQLHCLADRYPTVCVEKYVIMPNHIHILFLFQNEAAGASPCPTLPEVICSYKSLTTRMCRKAGFEQIKLFQSSFHDRIVRNEAEYLRIWEYIDTNPSQWSEDCFYS